MTREDEKEHAEPALENTVGTEQGEGRQAQTIDTKTPAEAAEGTAPADTNTILSSKAAGIASREAHEESLSRKRDREGSIEPSSAPSTTANEKSTSDALPAKKNRLLGSVDDDDDGDKASKDEPNTSASTDDPTTTPKIGSADNEKVGQIRQRVEELSYDERETKRADLGEKRQSLDTATSATASGNDTADVLKAVPQAAQSSPTPARKQPTFSSFSASSSPFASSSANAGVSGPSWLAGSSSGGSSSTPPGSASAFGKAIRTSGGMSGTTGAIKASVLGGGSPSVSEAAPSPSPSVESPSGRLPASAAAPLKSSASLGFGAFAAARPFTGGGKTATGTSAAGSGPSTPNSQADESDAVKSPPPGESIFDQRQTPDTDAKNGDTRTLEQSEEADGEKGKVKVSKVAESELATGEEHERAVHSVRAKLYTMSKNGEDGTAADGTWKERGTGTLRVNVPKSAKGPKQAVGARLVMRAEGVYRLILNVALFKGMKVELAQEKFVRIVALESGKLVHFAIKVSNPSAAYELFRAIKVHIPVAAPSYPSARSETTTATGGGSPPALPPRTSTATGFAFHKDDVGGVNQEEDWEDEVA